MLCHMSDPVEMIAPAVPAPEAHDQRDRASSETDLLRTLTLYSRASGTLKIAVDYLVKLRYLYLSPPLNCECSILSVFCSNAALRFPHA
jgi:hypothetical protein